MSKEIQYRKEILSNLNNYFTGEIAKSIIDKIDIYGDDGLRIESYRMYNILRCLKMGASPKRAKFNSLEDAEKYKLLIDSLIDE